MCIRDDTDTWAVPQGLTFRQWLQTGQPGSHINDLDYHVTTLFPPVRRGYLELRMIDGQAGGCGGPCGRRRALGDVASDRPSLRPNDCTRHRTLPVGPVLGCPLRFA